MKIRTKRRCLYGFCTVLGIWGGIYLWGIASWWGLIGGPWLAYTAGIWLAEQFGWRRAESANDAFEQWSEGKKQEQLKYGDSLILLLTAMLAKLAKFDGIVTHSEIKTVEDIFSELGIDGESRTALIDIFREAKNGPLTFYDTVLVAKHFYALDSQSLRLIMLFLIQLAHSDDHISEQVQEALEDASTALGFNYNEIFQAYQSSRDEHGSISYNASYAPEEAYAVLGCTIDSSIDDIKARYRELAKTFHPDTIAAKELPPEFIQFATEKFQQIQLAYETIIKYREPA